MKVRFQIIKIPKIGLIDCRISIALVVPPIVEVVCVHDMSKNKTYFYNERMMKYES